MPFVIIFRLMNEEKDLEQRAEFDPTIDLVKTVHNEKLTASNFPNQVHNATMMPFHKDAFRRQGLRVNSAGYRTGCTNISPFANKRSIIGAQ